MENTPNTALILTREHQLVIINLTDPSEETAYPHVFYVKPGETRVNVFDLEPTLMKIAEEYVAGDTPDVHANNWGDILNCAPPSLFEKYGLHTIDAPMYDLVLNHDDVPIEQGETQDDEAGGAKIVLNPSEHQEIRDQLKFHIGALRATEDSDKNAAKIDAEIAALEDLIVSLDEARGDVWTLDAPAYLRIERLLRQNLAETCAHERKLINDERDFDEIVAVKDGRTRLMNLGLKVWGAVHYVDLSEQEPNMHTLPLTLDEAAYLASELLERNQANDTLIDGFAYKDAETWSDVERRQYDAAVGREVLHQQLTAMAIQPSGGELLLNPVQRISINEMLARYMDVGDKYPRTTKIDLVQNLYIKTLRL